MTTLGGTPAPAPTVTLTGPSFNGTDFVVTEGSACTFNGQGVAAQGDIVKLLSLEVDGQQEKNSRVLNGVGASRMT